MIKKRIVMGVLRHALTAGGGWMVSSGWLSQDLMVQAVGLIITMVGLWWSADSKRHSTAIPEALPLPPNHKIPPTLPDNLPVQMPPALYDEKPYSGFILSDRSRENLAGVHPLLARIVETAIAQTPVDFAVTEGKRTEARQQQLIAQNKSWVTRSRHQDGLAVDLAALPDNEVSWDWKYYEQLNEVMQEAARQCGCRVTWGGHWKQRDGVHFQLESETT